jgi:hypothetical protein
MDGQAGEAAGELWGEQIKVKNGRDRNTRVTKLEVGGRKSGWRIWSSKNLATSGRKKGESEKVADLRRFAERLANGGMVLAISPSRRAGTHVIRRGAFSDRSDDRDV